MMWLAGGSHLIPKSQRWNHGSACAHGSYSGRVQYRIAYSITGESLFFAFLPSISSVDNGAYDG